MHKITGRLQRWEQHSFRFVNQRLRHVWLDRLFTAVTHLGGASCTIAASLSLALLGTGPLHTAALQAAVALAVSHLPVAVMKKACRRPRPYLVLPGTHTGAKPLKDYSFPSGHSTAIASVVLPFVGAFPMLGPALLPLALLVTLSRIYLGLHYPSDCLAGSAIGTLAACGTAALWG